jgi:hypothetical protein
MNDIVMSSKQYIDRGPEVFLALTFKQWDRYLNFSAWFMTNVSVI